MPQPRISATDCEVNQPSGLTFSVRNTFASGIDFWSSERPSPTISSTPLIGSRLISLGQRFARSSTEIAIRDRKPFVNTALACASIGTREASVLSSGPIQVSKCACSRRRVLASIGA